jgi:HEAT repeat protein
MDLNDELEFLADDGHAQFKESATRGDRGTIVLGPVSDPDAFVRGIDFATVYRVQDRVITIGPKSGRGADRMAKALAALNSDSPSRRKAGLRRLLAAKPDERWEQVARALEGRLNDPDDEVRMKVILALGVWGTKESVTPLLDALRNRKTWLVAADALRQLHEAGVLPEERRGEVARALERILEDKNWSHVEVILVLGRLKDEESAEPLAQRLEEVADRQAAGEALRALGPAAEKAVAKRLQHEDVGVRWAACEILGDIGTPASIPALKALENDRFFPARVAQDAARRITARHGAAPEK